MTRNKTKSKPPKINPKHAQFVEEYLLDWNATRAYLAVYSTKNEGTAGTNAQRLLRSARVKEYLAKRVDERNAELKIDQTYVVKKLHEIVESDYCGQVRYLTEDQLEDLPLNVRKLIQSVKIKKHTTRYNRSDVEHEDQTYEVRFMSKDKAIELLGKHTGAFNKDNDSNINVNVKGFAAIINELDI